MIKRIPLRKFLKEEKLQGLKMKTPLCCDKGLALKDVLKEMREKKQGCAIITDHDEVAGIFTDRDALTRTVEQGVDLATPIEKFMTSNPKVLRLEDSVGDAIRLMSKGTYRHIPLVDAPGNVRGIVSVRDIVWYLAEHFPYEVYNLPPDPQQVMSEPEGA